MHDIGCRWCDTFFSILSELQELAKYQMYCYMFEDQFIEDWLR